MLCWLFGPGGHHGGFRSGLRGSIYGGCGGYSRGGTLLLLASIRDPNPAIFVQPKILYCSAVKQVSTDDCKLPLGREEFLVPWYPDSGADLALLTRGHLHFFAARNAN